MINITNDDVRLLRQHEIIVKVKIEIINDTGQILGVVSGMVSDSCSSNIDSSSDVRRTFSTTIVPDDTTKKKFDLSPASIIWLNKYAHLYLGIKNLRTDEYRWFSQGYFVFTSNSITYNATTNKLSISCSDFMTKLDGTINGQLGALTTTIPAYEDEKDSSGNYVYESDGTTIKKKYNILRDAFVKTLSQLGGVDNYYVDDIGEFYGMKETNPTGYLEYRTKNPSWNYVPYDLEFNAGDSVCTMLQKIRDLYPDYQMYFDADNKFILEMIPSLYEDNVTFNNAFLQSILLSSNGESTTRDYTAVKNCTKVWGKVIEVDNYTDTVTSSTDTYTATCKGYDTEGKGYLSGDKFGFKAPTTNVAGQKMIVTNGTTTYSSVAIYDDDTHDPIKAGVMIAGNDYVLKMDKEYSDGSYTYKWYLLGAYQVQGISVLTDGTISDTDYVYTASDGTKTTCKVFSQQYFELKYGCNNVELNIVPGSPYTVQNIGERWKVLTGGEYENIEANSLALARAHYENWKSCRLTDSITITTLLVPWADVDIKVAYQMQNATEESTYIVKSVAQDYSAFTTTWTLSTFYPLYEPTK